MKIYTERTWREKVLLRTRGEEKRRQEEKTTKRYKIMIKTSQKKSKQEPETDDKGRNGTRKTKKKKEKRDTRLKNTIVARIMAATSPESDPFVG